MYLEDVVTGAHSVLPFDDLSLPPKRRRRWLRLVNEAGSASQGPHVADRCPGVPGGARGCR